VLFCAWATARPDHTKDDNRTNVEHTNTAHFFPVIETTPL
jgi:hypothetical protein